MILRLIRPEDNLSIARIIRRVMTEFGAVGPGYSIEDPEVDAMFETYTQPRAVFYVIENQGKMLGCGGIAPLAGGEADVCELKKMYFLPEARGQGWGRRLVAQLESDAREQGFRRMYLETVARMETANHLYRRMAFQPLPSQLGNTGHSSCDLFYIKEL